MLPRAFLLGTLMLLVVAACSSDSVTTGGVFDNCSPGTVRSCVGPSGCMGNQVCEPDGAGYDLCDCRASTAASVGSTTGVGGATTSSGQGAGNSTSSGQGGATTSTGAGANGSGGSGGAPPPGCDVAGYTPANNPLAQHYGTMLEVQIPQLGANGIDLMLIELHYADGASDQPRTVSLTGENFDTCVDCLRIRSHTGAYYLADSGTMEITANGDVGDSFTVELTDVDLVEVTIDPNTRTSTVVSNGETWCISSMVATVPITAGTGQCTTPPNDPLFDCNSAQNGCNNPCEVVSQCGCAPGASCSLDFNNGNNICISAGTATAGDSCMGNTDCAAGHACLISGMVESCYQYCDTAADCPGNGGCEITVNPQTQQWCTLSCNPLNGTGCPTALACEIGTGSPNYTLCRQEGNGGQGASCTNGNDCQDGYTCVSVNQNPNTCQRWCNVANPSCPGNSTCTAFNPGLVLGNSEYGACI